MSVSQPCWRPLNSTINIGDTDGSTEEGFGITDTGSVVRNHIVPGGEGRVLKIQEVDTTQEAETFRIPKALYPRLYSWLHIQLAGQILSGWLDVCKLCWEPQERWFCGLRVACLG